MFKFIALLLAANAFAVLAKVNQPAYVPGELLVKFKSKPNKGWFASNGLELQREVRLSKDVFYVVKVPVGQELVESQSLHFAQEVEYAEPNYIYTIDPIASKGMSSVLEKRSRAYSQTNDPRFDELWGLRNTGNNSPDGSQGVIGADIDALRAWEMTTGNNNVKIAVIDTGVDYNHPDLARNMMINDAEFRGEEGVDDDGNGFVDDIYGYDFANNDADPYDGHNHGTHCAGTIGAVHNNNEGVAGVIDQVQILAIKFLSDSGSGTTEAAIKAIDYATRRGVDIMSNSWGGGGRSQALEDVIRKASEAGIVFVAAAGNSSSDNDANPQYPANYPVENVISVAAHTSADSLASFSSFGNETVHIAAPGHRILSTVKNGGYEVYSGTSMATPHVSGALGLFVAQEGRVTHDALKERLMLTSVPVPGLRGKTIKGGRLNAYNLLSNTRPTRVEPKPDAWETVTLDEPWESAHPYENNQNVSKVFSVPGAKFIRLKFEKYDLENAYDYVQISSATRQFLERVTGKGEDYSTDYIVGDSLLAVFRSDRSVQSWGFVVKEIEVQY